MGVSQFCYFSICIHRSPQVVAALSPSWENCDHLSTWLSNFTIVSNTTARGATVADMYILFSCGAPFVSMHDQYLSRYMPTHHQCQGWCCGSSCQSYWKSEPFHLCPSRFIVSVVATDSKTLDNVRLWFLLCPLPLTVAVMATYHKTLVTTTLKSTIPS
jgi:hypothetical protein